MNLVRSSAALSQRAAAPTVTRCGPAAVGGKTAIAECAIPSESRAVPGRGPSSVFAAPDAVAVRWLCPAAVLDCVWLCFPPQRCTIYLRPLGASQRMLAPLVARSQAPHQSRKKNRAQKLKLGLRPILPRTQLGGWREYHRAQKPRW